MTIDPSPGPAARPGNFEGEASLPDQASFPGEDGSSEEDDLRVSLSQLSQLASGRLDLEVMLESVARLAVQAIPGADGAGLTLIEADRSNTIVASAEFVSEIDDIQYSLGQGPCITAAATGQTVSSGSLGGDARWTHFGARVARLGVHSVLSLPLIAPDGVVGAMNIYAHPKNAFDERAARVGEWFSIPAAIAVQNAQVLAQTKRLAAQLQTALTHRAVVDRAIGILMSRSGVTEAEALTRLRTMSQHDHEKLAVVAGRIVEEAVRRARARQSHQAPDPSARIENTRHRPGHHR